MLTVWRKPCQTYRIPIAGFYWIYLPYILTIMFRVRMIHLVHSDGFWIMIDGYVHTVSCCQLNTSGSTATTSKIIYYQLTVDHLFAFSSSAGSRQALSAPAVHQTVSRIYSYLPTALLLWSWNILIYSWHHLWEVCDLHLTVTIKHQHFIFRPGVEIPVNLKPVGIPPKFCRRPEC